jgi:myo-inositol-1(or 4)-monophosphatase
MSNVDLDELRGWLHESGEVGIKYFNKGTGRRKADASWVTEADLTIEHMLTQHLAARYPEYGILGEEQVRQGLDREFIWALDPIDGTASFVAGLPIWGISLGLLRHGTPYFGLLYFPMMGDWYWAEAGGAAFLNNESIHVSTADEWDSESWISVPSDIHRRFDIDFIGKVRNLGSTAASICYAARGSAVGSLFTHASIWDVAAALTVLYAAGGVAITLSGDKIDTAKMIASGACKDPILAGAPKHVASLRPHIAVRPRI